MWGWGFGESGRVGGGCDVRVRGWAESERKYLYALY